MRSAIWGAVLALGLAASPALGATVLDPDATYTVKAGDTLYGLAAAWLVPGPSSAAVRAANDVRKVKALKIGSMLRIPGALLKSEPIKAEILAFSGQVTLDTGTGPMPVKLGMTVGQGALIATGPNAFVTLTLPDESRITLPSVSRVRVTRLRHVQMSDSIDRVFTVEAGRSEHTVTPMTNPNSRYIVDSPVASSAVRGTVFRMAYDPAAAHGATEVVQGVVGVTGGTGGEVEVSQTFGVAVDAMGVSAAIKLLDPPVFANAGRVQDGADVQFAAAPSQSATAYRIQLANDAGFIDTFHEETSTDGAFRLAGIKDGTYFLRATAIDSHGLEGLPRVYSFTRELNTLEGGAPAVSGVGKLRKYVFRWNTSGDGVKTYRFQIFLKADTGRPLVDEAGLDDKIITLTNLPPGTYAWRVIVSTFRDGRVLLKEGPLQDIEIGQ